MKYTLISMVAAGLLAASFANAEGPKAPPMQPPFIKDMRMMASGTTPGGVPPAGGEHGRPMMGSGTPTMMPPVMFGTNTPMCRKFARGLALGNRGDDVKELQEMLREKGFLNGSSTGYFGPMTKAAVVKFQKESGLNPSGYFGELSRKMHEKRCGKLPLPELSYEEDNKGRLKGTTTLPRPCFTNATSTGCEHSNAFPPKMGSGTPPAVCTMEARLCADGTMMPRDNQCGWHPEQCKPIATTTSTTGTTTTN